MIGVTSLVLVLLMARNDIAMKHHGVFDSRGESIRSPMEGTSVLAAMHADQRRCGHKNGSRYWKRKASRIAHEQQLTSNPELPPYRWFRWVSRGDMLTIFRSPSWVFLSRSCRLSNTRGVSCAIVTCQYTRSPTNDTAFVRHRRRASA